MVVAFSAQSGFVSVVVKASNARTREIPQARNMLITSLAANYLRRGTIFQANFRRTRTRCFAPFALQNSPNAVPGLHSFRIHAVIKDSMPSALTTLRRRAKAL